METGEHRSGDVDICFASIPKSKDNRGIDINIAVED